MRNLLTTRQVGSLQICYRRNSSVAVVAEEHPEMSPAMRYYYERKRSVDKFMKVQRDEFERGKHNLANMMGFKSVDDMTQEDIDNAIDYLFPSGLTDKSARPVMQPPDQLYQRTKNAEFDNRGRPFSSFFYTSAAVLYQNLFDVVCKYEEALDLYMTKLRNKVPLNSADMLQEPDLATTEWIPMEKLRDRLNDRMNQKQYKELILTLTRIIELPVSYHFKEFIFQYRQPLIGDNDSAVKSEEAVDPANPYSNESLSAKLVKDLHFDELTGLTHAESLGYRKTSCALVRVTMPGSGKFSLQHMDHLNLDLDITYFPTLRDRSQILYPLQFASLVNKVDVSALVYGGGPGSQAGAVRFALATCISRLVNNKELVEEMHLVGLLTQDIRTLERCRPGRWGARRRHTWRKR